MNKSSVFVLAIGMATFMGCNKSEDIPSMNVPNLSFPNLNLPVSPYAYDSFELPAYISSNLADYDDTKKYGEITNWGATLGRVIFYDKLVSKKQTVSCASCHIQEFGFSDTAVFSLGDDGGRTGRHSMGLANARFRVGEGFFWDERATTLEDQVLMPIQDPVEMNMTLDTLVSRMKATDYYPVLFQLAFGEAGVSEERIASALAQFVRSMTSFESKFDEGLAMHSPQEPFSNFTAQENMGKSVFMRLDKGKCASCHSTEAMITDFARNNGLSPRSSDGGVGDLTGNPMDFGRFRAPSLRNIAIRPPYMHNGGMTSLTQVVAGYNSEIAFSPSLDPHFIAPGGNAAISLNLSTAEVDALVAFLETLTDHNFLNDVKFSDPFIP